MKINLASHCSANCEYIMGRSYQLWEGQISIQLIKERFWTGYWKGIDPAALPIHCPISPGKNLLTSWYNKFIPFNREVAKNQRTR